MRNDEILTLARAGYSRAEIGKILSDAPAAEYHEPTAPTASQNENPVIDEKKNISDFSKISEKIEKLTEAIYKNNVGNSTIQKTEPEMTLEKIMENMAK